MLRNIIPFVVLFLGHFSLWSQSSVPSPDGIQFSTYSISEALKKAEELSMPVFVDVYASWCGPCKMMKRNTFSNENVGLLFNEKFINIMIDGDTKEGKVFSKTYKVKGYPTLLFLDSQGKVLSFNQGFHSSNQLMKIASQILKTYENK
jgi:thioredoxin 1